MKTLFNVPKKEVSNKYSRKILAPQYVPSKVNPQLWELYDDSKYVELVKNVSLSNIPSDVKEFLKLSATRHIIFNYAKIADYYAHAEPKIQQLMEESALVILDFDDAIANGYVRLSKTIDDIVNGANND